MSEIPEDIKEAAYEAMRHVDERGALGVLSKAISTERARCIEIASSIDPHNEAEAHLIETIVRRMRGEE